MANELAKRLVIRLGSVSREDRDDWTLKESPPNGRCARRYRFDLEDVLA